MSRKRRVEEFNRETTQTSKMDDMKYTEMLYYKTVCNSMIEFNKHYVELRKVDTQNHIWFSLYINFFNGKIQLWCWDLFPSISLTWLRKPNMGSQKSEMYKENKKKNRSEWAIWKRERGSGCRTRSHRHGSQVLCPDATHSAGDWGVPKRSNKDAVTYVTVGSREVRT